MHFFLKIIQGNQYSNGNQNIDIKKIRLDFKKRENYDITHTRTQRKMNHPNITDN